MLGTLGGLPGQSSALDRNERGEERPTPNYIKGILWQVSAGEPSLDTPTGAHRLRLLGTQSSSVRELRYSTV